MRMRTDMAGIACSEEHFILTKGMADCSSAPQTQSQAIYEATTMLVACAAVAAIHKPQQPASCCMHATLLASMDKQSACAKKMQGKLIHSRVVKKHQRHTN